MINAVSWNDLNSNFVFGDGVSTKAKIWLFISFIIAFAAVIAAAWIGISHWFQASPNSQYGGIAIIVENVLIFASALIYRFSKPKEEDGF